jgi:hypothetical protein
MRCSTRLGWGGSGKYIAFLSRAALTFCPANGKTSDIFLRYGDRLEFIHETRPNNPVPQVDFPTVQSGNKNKANSWVPTSIPSFPMR